MPVKFKEDSITVDRKTGKKSIQRHYIKNTSKEELFEAINKTSTKPKLRQKCINELERRGIKIDWVKE
jgi:hypothetical protein